MKNIILLIVAIILITVGTICYFAMDTANIKINGVVRHDQAARDLAKYLFGGIMGGLGAIFLVISLIGFARGSKQGKQHQYIMQNGIPTEGTVTFVDKNYLVLVNNKPIYSIVEYIYKDKIGNQYTRKLTNANSDLIIRNQIQVGSKINVKYSVENPAESLLII
jgi:hypothetical protein